MSVIRVLTQAEAASQQRAVRLTAYRHRHIEPNPMVVCLYNLSGEAAAPLAIAYGTRRNSMKIVVSAEPRNRESRFAALNEFAADFHGYIRPYLRTETREGRRRDRSFYEFEAAVDAPQIIVPNHASQTFLGEKLGRSLRYLGLGSTHPVPDATAWTGSHLSWMAEHSHFPGQSVFLSVTELLNRHFSTGQSALENENLATLLAWIANPAGSGMAAIRAAERQLPFGPVPDPAWDAGLEPFVAAYTKAMRAGDVNAVAKVERDVRKLIQRPLSDAYKACFEGLAVLRKIPEAASVDSRWQEDIRAWGGHARRSSHGIPRFRRRHDPITAARKLEAWSRALETLEADEAFDDPLVMAELDASGQCLTGSVTRVESSNSEVKPGNTRRSVVPLVHLRLNAPTRLLEGMEVVWAGDRSVVAVVRRIPAAKTIGEVVLAVLQGHVRGTRLPLRGSRTLFVAMNVFKAPAPDDPLEVPWTHRNGDEGDPESKLLRDMAYLTADEAGAAGANDGSPDLTPEELASISLIGVVALGEVPGVVL